MLDPYCPHLGANMVDGKVVGDCIECPFHGFRFSGESGKCTHIPYSDAPPPSAAAVQAWPVRESHGMVLVWFDHDRRPPAWEPPLAPQSGLRLHGRAEHRVGCHLQEIPENGADVAHLDYLHGPFFVPFLRPLNHLWTDVTWQPGGPGEEHLAHIRLTQSFSFLGRPVPGSRVEVAITQIGLGMVQLSFRTLLGRVFVIETYPRPAAPQSRSRADWPRQGDA